MFQINNDDKRKNILQTNSNLLVLGGPGSGKTTIALFKAQKLIKEKYLEQDQKILFLSFARATISRVEEQAGGIISTEQMKMLEINTYHGFTWNLLKNHGYLLNKKHIKLLAPHEAAVRLSGVEEKNRTEELSRLFYEEGLVHFDLFASLCSSLIENSNSLRTLIYDVYPTIILDEFQDTNSDEWKLISLLGNSTLIALADPKQRIYDFRGADPKRLSEFNDTFKPITVDFETENNRSNGTDIVAFGNDLLSSKNVDRTYNNVTIKTYTKENRSTKHLHLKSLVLDIRFRLQSKITDQNWSLAVLVPTNSLMIEISDILLKEQNFKSGKSLPIIYHDVSVETAGPSLAGVLIGRLLEQNFNKSCTQNDILLCLCNHILGRRGNIRPSQEDVDLTQALKTYLETDNIKGNRRALVINSCNELANRCNEYKLSGNINQDWLKMRSLLDESKSNYLVQVGKDARYLRLLRKGSLLYSSLANTWRENGRYFGAEKAISDALTQEHFALNSKTWSGINIMTIHKAKGKEFDEVIIYEGMYKDRIVSRIERIEQARLNLRVAVTRAKSQATILTPKDKPCELI